MQTVTDPADPRRCKGTTTAGQCLAVAADGSDYCLQHNGVDRGQGRRLRKYLLATAEDQGLLARYADDDELKSLREEIGLTRVMIQNTMAGAQSEVEKINAYAKVNGYLLTLEKLMKTCHTLDQSMGNLIGKPALRRLGRELAQAVMSRLKSVPNHEPIVEAVLGDFARIIEEIDNGTPEPAAGE